MIVDPLMLASPAACMTPLTLTSKALAVAGLYRTVVI